MDSQKQSKFKHVSFYKFVNIDSPESLQSWFKSSLLKWNLKGTVLIAPEGINAMIAGAPLNLDSFLQEFQIDERFKNILFKFNESQTAPFKRTLIKIKKEVLTFKEPTVSPAHKTGNYVKPQELRNWIEKKEDFIFLDTRNDFEVQYGTFENAINPKIKSFTELKNFLSSESAEKIKKKKIVTFCTGGIRCEKATAYMMEKGFENVWQIEGGILQYFSDTDAMGWQGECFVFDERIAVNKKLQARSDSSASNSIEK